MKIVQRIAAEKRMALALVAVAIGLATALQVGVVYPLATRVEDARARRSAAEQGLADAVRRLVTVRTTADGKQRTDADLERFYGEILPHDLTGARDLTARTVASLADRHQLRLQRRSSVIERNESGRLAHLGTSTLLAGEWPDIRRFIYDLEMSPAFIVIEDIVLTQTEDVEASVVLTLALATYYPAKEDT